MKKVLSVFLVIIMCFTLAGCGSKDIELTTLNYDDYLVLNLNYGMGGRTDDLVNKAAGTTCYSAIEPNFKISAASNNFVYNNVRITIRIYGTYKAWSFAGLFLGKKDGEIKELDETITISCNVGGSGSYSDLIYLDEYSNLKALNIAYEVVSVSGSVTPV